MKRDDPFEPHWHGDLPLEERQAIEDYQTQIEPLVHEILSGLEGLNIGDIERLGESHLDGCSERDERGNINTRAFQVWGAGFAGDVIDVDAAAALMEAIVIPAGFTRRTQVGDETGVLIEWHNTQDGGLFSFRVRANSHSVVSYRSGCRPTNGATHDHVRDRVTPEWETHYPRLKDTTDATPAP